MSWISTQFARHWRNIHITIIVLLSALVLFGPPTIHTVLNQAIIGGFYYPFYRLKAGWELLLTEAETNAKLQQSLIEASLQISLYEEALRENARLRAALGFEPPPGYHLVPAKVISVSEYQLPVSVIINRGMRDSLTVNQPVINQEGLIGRISEITPDFAIVQLLTDPSNRVAARVASSREMGIVKYKLKEGMVLDNFPLHGTIAPGDTIISSGLGGVYPPGLIVGTVVKVNRDESKPFCRVNLQPAANFHSIEELFVLKPDYNR